MNLRGSWALIRKSLFQYMSNRGFFWTLALLWMTGPLLYLFVWMAAAGQGSVGEFRRDDFVFYYLCLIVVNQFTYPVSNWTIGDSIRFGWFSAWLLRPISPLYEAIATDLSTKMVSMPFALGVAILLGAVLHTSFTLSLSAVLIFILAVLLAQAMRFLLAYTLALFTLWTQRSDALLRLNDVLFHLFGGQMAPTLLLPGILYPIAQALPYRYMIGFPIEALMGRLNREQILMGLGVQLGWLLIILVLQRIVWRRGLRHYTAVGG